MDLVLKLTIGGAVLWVYYLTAQHLNSILNKVFGYDNLLVCLIIIDCIFAMIIKDCFGSTKDENETKK